MYLLSTVKDILETSIDSLVDNFVRQPYIHRCEHSIHCELYAMLTVHRALQGLYSLNGSKDYSTTLIHKEWPETEPRPEKNGRRGNFDLVILDPDEVLKHTVQDFNTGQIKPAFVVEIGLNYGLDHLKNDDKKLYNSKCKNGYLVHLWQPHKGIPKDKLKTLRDWLPNANFPIAAAILTDSGSLIKHLNDTDFT